MVPGRPPNLDLDGFRPVMRGDDVPFGHPPAQYRTVAEHMTTNHRQRRVLDLQVGLPGNHGGAQDHGVLVASESVV
jgi:hypothetical protein